MMRVTHPDVLRLIHAKTSARADSRHISVNVPQFLKAVDENEWFQLD